VNGSHQKPLIERRRRHSEDHSQLAFYPGPPHHRRADDQMRVRVQRWFELADVALREKFDGPEDGDN